jgi:hypothetical protein
LKKKEDSVQAGNVYKHQRTKDYLTQQHWKSNNSLITVKLIASEHSCKILHHQNLFNIPVEGDQENKTGMGTFSTT